MKASTRKKLENAGWQVGSAADFLGLDEGEQVVVKMKLALAKKVRESRQAQSVTQAELAKRIGSSQSRIAKIEIPDQSVSIELLVRSLVSLGETQDSISSIIAPNVAVKANAKLKAGARRETKSRRT